MRIDSWLSPSTTACCPCSTAPKLVGHERLLFTDPCQRPLEPVESRGELSLIDAVRRSRIGQYIELSVHAMQDSLFEEPCTLTRVLAVQRHEVVVGAE